MALFSFGSGRHFANSVADYLGIERGLFGTALLESGITWAHFKELKNANITIDAAAESVMMRLLYGLSSLERKFGPQDEINKAKAVLKCGPTGSLSDNVAASEMAKTLFTTDQYSNFPDSPSILRHQLFSQVVHHYELPGGLDSARVLAVLWATVADKAMRIADVALEIRMSVERTQDACDTLRNSALMDRGEARNGVVYYRLNDAGMIGGRRLAFEWLHIVEKVPFPA